MTEDAAALELLPAAQLKRRAAVLGVSLAGCFDKREMARRLAAAAPSPPSPAAIDEPGSPLRRTQEPAVSPSPSPSPSPDLNAMSMRELKHLSKTYSVDLTGCIDRQDAVLRLRGALSASPEAPAGAEASPGRPGAAPSTSAAAAAALRGGGAHPRPADALGARLRTAVAGAGVAAPPVTRSAGAGTDKAEDAWEEMSMRELRQQCRQRGVDIAGCFTKAAVVGRLRGSRAAAAPAAPGAAAVAPRGASEAAEVAPPSSPDRPRTPTSPPAQHAPASARFPAPPAPPAPLAQHAQAAAAVLAAPRTHAAAASGGAAEASVASAQAPPRPPPPAPAQPPAAGGGRSLGGGLPSPSARPSLADAGALNEGILWAMRAHELRRECDSWKVDLDGCLDKADVVSALLGAVANAKANKEGPRGGRAGGGAPCLRDLRRECALRGVASAGMGREAMASALASHAREGAPARELRRLCWLLGVDVEGVRDRAAVVGMLRAAAGGKAPP